MKARKEFEVEFDDGDYMTVVSGDKCIVDEIIGYGYNLRKDSSDRDFRVMNSSMPDYFDIVEMVEPEKDLDNYDKTRRDGYVITLLKDFEIKDVVKISKGQQFLHFVDVDKDGIFHDIFSIDGKSRTLRMEESEFKEYF